MYIRRVEEIIKEKAQGKEAYFKLEIIDEAIQERLEKLTVLSQLLLATDEEVDKILEELELLVEEGRWLSENPFGGKEL